MITASIIVPAHNEERSIARLLDLLIGDGESPEFEIVVVCNGCTDATAAVARTFEPQVRVIDLPEPSKFGALRRGDTEAGHFPRLYIDSDVEIDAQSVRELIAALLTPDTELLAAAPVRVIPRLGASWPVRWYYDVWEELPQVRQSPFGRGVIALSKVGFERVSGLPSVMSDDLAMTAALAAYERTVVTTAKVVIRPPRTVGDLMRRRIRVNTGNAQFDQMAPRNDSLRTSPRTLVKLIRRHPVLAPKVAVFLVITIASRIAARRRISRGDFNSWLRDESSRSNENAPAKPI